jgi:hypothetical protein
MCHECIAAVENLSGFFVDLATGMKDLGVLREIGELASTSLG